MVRKLRPTKLRVRYECKAAFSPRIPPHAQGPSKAPLQVARYLPIIIAALTSHYRNVYFYGEANYFVVLGLQEASLLFKYVEAHV
jgi:hypothetical protein